MIKSIKLNLKNIVSIIFLPLLVEFCFDVFVDIEHGRWDVEHYFWFFLLGIVVYVALEMNKKSTKDYFSFFLWEVLFKYQVVIIALIFNINSYIRFANDVNIEQSVQQYESEIAKLTATSVPDLNLAAQSELTAPKITEKSDHDAKRFLASNTVSQLQSFHEKVKAVMANNNVSTQSLTKEQEMHLMNIGMQLAQYAQSKQWEAFEKVVLAESGDVDTLTALTNAAIALSAPVDMIENFVNQGAQIFPTSTLHALSQGRIEFVKQLENFGVNIVDESSELHVLDMAMMMPMPAESFEFLLDKPFDLMSYKSSMGIDTLGIAIVNAPINPTASPRIIQSLLIKGAELNSHHIELLQRLSKDRPEIHTNIVNLLPVLGT